MQERILVYGDIHLCSKNYGLHRDYSKESLNYFKNITKTAEEVGATMIIGLGDFSYGRFKHLEYRSEVEKELKKQMQLCNGKRYELKGNHDSATYGMTEYEFYESNGSLLGSRNISIGNLRLSMIDSGKYDKTDILPTNEIGTTNIVLMHDFFKFKDTYMADYGSAIILDEFTKWYGVDYIIGGHVHDMNAFEGSISNGVDSHKTAVMYLGCPCRPSYREGYMQDKGYYAIITVEDDNSVSFDIHSFDLLSLEESFNLEGKAEAVELQEKKRLDVTDIVEKLDGHKRVMGEPEDVIMSMSHIDIKYREKAIELLKVGQDRK